MTSPSDPLACSVRGCSSQAALTCDRCGQPCCSSHARTLTLQRRPDADTVRGYRDMLARIPTRTETYVLCPRCRTKPFGGKIPPPDDGA